MTEHRPDRVAVERLYFQRNVATAMAVGQAPAGSPSSSPLATGWR